jgi:hypothetical protein
MEATEEAESPRSFIFWAYLFCISSVTRRNIYLRKGSIYKLYPNLFILLIADSGLRKQFPIDMANSLLMASSCCRVISGTNSIQGIIKTLSKSHTLENGTQIKGADGALLSDEFSTLLVDDPLALTTLLKLYDTHAGEKADGTNEWEKTLKSEKVKLRNIYLTLLGATNLDQFDSKVAEKDMRGGFMARTLSIVETKPAKLNSLLRPGIPIDYKSLSLRLREINRLKGEFVIDEPAIKLFDDWYHDFFSSPKQDKTGFLKRIHDHILKVAMCLSLSHKDELIIGLDEMYDAMDICLPLVDSSIEMGRSTGKSKYKTQTAIVIQAIIKAPEHKILRRKLIRDNFGEFTHKDLNEIIETLRQGGYIETCMIGPEGEEEDGYKLTNRCEEELEKIRQ